VRAGAVARDGLEAYDAGRYDEAIDKLSRAYEVAKLPTLAVHTARALAKAGRLVEASEVTLAGISASLVERDRIRWIM
jgi:uncharacterized protein HemY